MRGTRSRRVSRSTTETISPAAASRSSAAAVADATPTTLGEIPHVTAGGANVVAALGVENAISSRVNRDCTPNLGHATRVVKVLPSRRRPVARAAGSWLSVAAPRIEPFGPNGTHSRRAHWIAYANTTVRPRPGPSWTSRLNERTLNGRKSAFS